VREKRGNVLKREIILKSIPKKTLHLEKPETNCGTAFCVMRPVRVEEPAGDEKFKDLLL
jgi:hypothetical protein